MSEATATLRDVVEAAAADDVHKLSRCGLVKLMMSGRALPFSAPPSDAALAAALDAIAVPRPPPPPLRGITPSGRVPSIPEAQQVRGRAPLRRRRGLCARSRRMRSMCGRQPPLPQR